MLQMIIAVMLGVVLASVVMTGLIGVLLSCKAVMRLYVRYLRKITDMVMEESLKEN